MKRISQEEFLIRVVRLIRGRLRLTFVWLWLRRAAVEVLFLGSNIAGAIPKRLETRLTVEHPPL